MTEEPSGRPRRRFIEREEPAKTPEEARQRRARAMTGIGSVLLVWGLVVLIFAGEDGPPPAAFVIALVGGGLLVGGLIVRP